AARRCSRLAGGAKCLEVRLCSAKSGFRKLATQTVDSIPYFPPPSEVLLDVPRSIQNLANNRQMKLPHLFVRDPAIQFADFARRAGIIARPGIIHVLNEDGRNDEAIN